VGVSRQGRACAMAPHHSRSNGSEVMATDRIPTPEDSVRFAAGPLLLADVWHMKELQSQEADDRSERGRNHAWLPGETGQGLFVQQEDAASARRKHACNSRRVHGLLVQREDTTLARSGSEFESRAVHYGLVHEDAALPCKQRQPVRLRTGPLRRSLHWRRATLGKGCERLRAPRSAPRPTKLHGEARGL